MGKRRDAGQLSAPGTISRAWDDGQLATPGSSWRPTALPAPPEEISLYYVYIYICITHIHIHTYMYV